MKRVPRPRGVWAATMLCLFCLPTVARLSWGPAGVEAGLAPGGRPEGAAVVVATALGMGAGRAPAGLQPEERLAALESWAASLLSAPLRGGGGGEEEEGVAEGEIEVQLQHDAENIGDAQSLRDFADYLQTAGKKLPLARQLYTRALQLEPASVRIHCSLGRLLHTAEQLDSAHRHYQAALLLNPRDIETLSCAAVLAQDRRELDQADVLYQQVLAVSPQSAHTHSNYATLLLEIEHAARLSAPDVPRNLSWTHAQRAEYHLQQAIALQPANTHALYNYAVMKQQLRGNVLDAAQALVKVLALRPSDADANYNYGVALLDMADALVAEGIKLLRVRDRAASDDQESAGMGVTDGAAAGEDGGAGGGLAKDVNVAAGAEEIRAEMTRVRTAVDLFRRAEALVPGRSVQVAAYPEGNVEAAELPLADLVSQILDLLPCGDGGLAQPGAEGGDAARPPPLQARRGSCPTRGGAGEQEAVVRRQRHEQASSPPGVADSTTADSGARAITTQTHCARKGGSVGGPGVGGLGVLAEACSGTGSRRCSSSAHSSSPPDCLSNDSSLPPLKSSV